MTLSSTIKCSDFGVLGNDSLEKRTKRKKSPSKENKKLEVEYERKKYFQVSQKELKHC